MPNTDNATIRVDCDSCGAKFKCPLSKAGKRGPCPKCGHMLMVPRLEPDPAASGDVDWSMVTDAGGNDGYDLADPEPAPPRVIPPRPVARAPQAHRPARAAPAAGQIDYRALGAARPEGAGVGRLVLGGVLAGVAAVIGTVLWIGLWAFSGRQFGIAAIGLGAVVGGGMFLGYGQRTVVAGCIASAFAAGAILLTKAIPASLIVLLGWGMSAGAGMLIMPYSEQAAREEIAHELVPAVLEEQGMDFTYTSYEEDSEALKVAQERVKDLSSEEVELRYKRRQVVQCKEMDALAALLRTGSEDMISYEAFEAEAERMSLAECNAYLSAWQPPSGIGFWGAMGLLLHPMDLLWIVLALGTAFKISGL